MQRMSIGASAYTAFSGTLEEFCRLLDELGFDRIELRNFIGGDGCVDGRDVARIKETLRRTGLRSTIHAPWKLNLAAESRDERTDALAQYQRAIDIAHELGSDVLVFHGGWHAHRPTGHDLLAHAARELLVHARGGGVTLALENDEISRPTLFHHPEDFAAIDVPGLGFVLDVGHANTHGHTAAEFVAVMQGRIAEVHVHDNDGRSDQHLPIGTGTVDWPGAVESLRDQRPFVTVVECYSPADLAASIATLAPQLAPSSGPV
jgi:sugar phosphate isomerase/epimerase